MSEELKELKDIKKLLMLLLIKSKATNVEIGKVLGVNDSRISQILNPLKNTKAKKNEQEIAT